MTMTDVAKACPRCAPATAMVVRQNGTTGADFLGCPNYARDVDDPMRCTHTEPLPLDMQLRRQGAATLPGF